MRNSSQTFLKETAVKDKQFLLDFLQAYLLWAENIEINPHNFRTDTGLCFNELLYSRDFSVKWKSQLMARLQDSFGDDYLLPFNSLTGECSPEHHERGYHLNPKRIAWVKKTIEELKIELSQQES